MKETLTVTVGQTEPVKYDSVFERLWRALIVRPVLWWQEAKCARAREYLLTHNDAYRFDHVSHEIVRRRNALYAKGVSPDDPSIPDRWKIDGQLPPMRWPRKDIGSF